MSEWWKGALIYQIYPRSFFDSNGDGVGDLAGVLAKLDYVASLGVDGVWLSPFFTSPMRDYGYDVADYRNVDPIFGALEDFDALIERAHALGLKVVIDQVYSHTSDRHPWFLESRASDQSSKADWYVWADAKPDGSPPNNWLSVFGGPAWSWDTRRRRYYLHNFLAEQPDLNFHNPAVQDALLDVARFWLDRGVDGFRLDVANYYFHDAGLRDNPPSGAPTPVRPYQAQDHRYNRSRPETPAFLRRLRELLNSYPDRMSVAEIASASPNVRSVEYTNGDDKLHTAYSFYFLDADKITADAVRGAMDAWSGVDAWPSWSFSNHDVPRALSRWGGADARQDMAKLYLALLVCLRGTVFIYQGEELGLPQAKVAFDQLRDPEAIRFWPETLGRDGCRTPMPWRSDAGHAGFSSSEPWLPIDPRHAALAVDAQDDDPASTLNFARRIFDLRRGSPALRSGDIVFLEAESPALVFERRSGTERIVCGFNLSDGSTRIPTDSLDGAQIIDGLDLGASVSESLIELPPWTGFIAVQTTRDA